MKPRNLYVLASCFLLVILVSCNHRPDCTNSNEIFEKYSPKDKEYKDELVRQLSLVDNSKLKYWIQEYAEIEGEEFIYFYIQGDGLCAIIEINMNPLKIAERTLNKHDGIKARHSSIGKTHTGIEFIGLTFDIVQDSLKTEFIFRDFEKYFD